MNSEEREQYYMRHIIPTIPLWSILSDFVTITNDGFFGHPPTKKKFGCCEIERTIAEETKDSINAMYIQRDSANQETLEVALCKLKVQILDKEGTFLYKNK